jgi:putative transposase
VDKMSIKVSGRWYYLCRAIDRDGNLLGSMLSKHRDRQAARRLLRRLIDAQGHKPLCGTTGKHPAYAKAIGGSLVARQARWTWIRKRT